MSVKMIDKIERIGGAAVQHGCLNDRIYLMDLRGAHPAHLIPKLLTLAREQGYSKIFAKVPVAFSVPFFKVGFKSEARIPDLYRAGNDGLFLGYYLDEEREMEADVTEIEQVFAQAIRSQDEWVAIESAEVAHTVERCGPADAEELARVYGEVFSTYPFPVDDPEYLRGQMDAQVEYFGVYVGKRLVSVAAAAFDAQTASVEMTDFATLPASRGNNFALALLARMEAAAEDKDVRTIYAITRAKAPAINNTFANRDFQFAGRLKNNNNISGRIESMNVWHKSLVLPEEEPTSPDA